MEKKKSSLPWIIFGLFLLLLAIPTIESFSSNEKIISKRFLPENSKSICDSGCNCQKENSFIAVICNYKENKINPTLGPYFNFPLKARQFIVILNSNTDFQIDEGLFDGAVINRLTIEAPQDHKGKVEISENAFKGSQGPYPDIQILNCHTIILNSKAFSREFKLNISNSTELNIASHTFYDTSFNGHFYNIKDIRIQEKAFFNANATLQFSKSSIEKLHRFEVSMREVLFDDCTIGTINTGTFDVFQINSLIFKQCRIGVIKSKAITEKLLGQRLSISDGNIGIIESQAIHGSGITEIILFNNTIETMGDHAIDVTSVNATITKNNFTYLGDNWLHVKQWSNVRIANNKFYDFGAINLEKTSTQVNCIFENNHITKARPNSLQINNKFCKIHNIAFNQSCICNMSWLESISSRDLRSESFCKINDILESCFNTTIFNVLRYEKEVCDDKKTSLDCMQNRNLYNIEDSFIELNDNNTKMYRYIAIGLVLMVLFALVLVALRCYKRNKPSQTCDRGNLDDGSSLQTNVLYENREFSEDDRRIINKTLEVIKQKYSPVYNIVKSKTDVLLRGNLSEKEILDAIGTIIAELEDCQNPGDDFVAFTDILAKHLNPPCVVFPPLPSAPPDPIYTEPTLFNNNVEAALVDHIYAEPNQLQQPLLNNDYATPADRNDLTALYSEPVNLVKDQVPPEYAKIGPKIISPYHQTTINKTLSQPSTSKNLPDVLMEASSNKPLTNVQKIANNFANNPKFHINRSPNTNRRIPIYTQPNKSGAIPKLPQTKVADGFDGSDLLEAASALPLSQDTGSNHSGGSNETIQMDDIIQYVDA